MWGGGSGAVPKHGMSDATFYKWKSRYGGLEVSEAKRLRVLEEENTKLKRLCQPGDSARRREAIHERGTTIGLDIGKRILQAHGARARMATD